MVGDTVHKGDTIASFDAAMLSANIANLQANVTQLKKQLQGLALSFRSNGKIVAGVTGYFKEAYVQDGDSVDTVVAEKGGIALIFAEELMNVQFQGAILSANEKATKEPMNASIPSYHIYQVVVYIKLNVFGNGFCCNPAY